MNRTIRRYHQGNTQELCDFIAPEEPLEIRIESEPFAVLLRSPGHDLDLALGFLFTEGIIEDITDVSAISHVDNPTAPMGNTVDVRLSAGTARRLIEFHSPRWKVRRELCCTELSKLLLSSGVSVSY